jgi:hypothetical protein
MNNGTWRKVAAILAGCALVVVGTDAVTYAATGNSLILGKINKAPTTTTLNNLGRGPVLNLIGGRANPPLKVNSKVKVANLNADSVDGLDSKVLEPGVTRIVLATVHSTPPSSPIFHRISLPAGTYQADITGIANNPTDSGIGNISCIVADQEKVFANPADPNYSGLFAVQEDLSLVYGGFALFGTSALFTLPAGHHVVYTCNSSAASGAVVIQSPMTVTFRKVSKVTTVSGPVWTPPVPRTTARLIQR